MVEDELALAVALDVRGRRRDELALRVDREVHREPAALRRDAAGALERVEPLETQKWRRALVEQRAVSVLPERADRGVRADLVHRPAGSAALAQDRKSVA